ncbi:MAG: methyltransferase domain-containing protein [Candidatus Omnitrophica bacterium]|nr:methyltransferase domain-containing protein [Candidatus Omnitrophota bacterium]
MEKDFDEVAEIYDGIFKFFIRDHYLNKRADFIKGIFSPGMKVLEVGCGTGILLSMLGSAGIDVYGIDNSKEMVAIASGKMPGRIFLGDVLNGLPFPWNFFDGVIFIATMHHLGGLKKVETAVANTLDVLKPAGKILIWDHNPMNLYWRFLMRRVPQDTGKEFLLSGRDILEIFKKNSMKNCKVFKKGFVPDFVNEDFFRLFRFLEKKLEPLPVLNLFLAHNVAVGEKNVER